MKKLFGTLSLLLILSSCHGDDGPTSPGTHCAVLAGGWTMQISNSCGGAATMPVAVVQTGCDISAITANGDGVTGTIDGNTIDIVFTGSCGSGRGTATISSNTSVSGNYSGQVTRTTCGCPLGPLTGSFALTR